MLGFGWLVEKPYYSWCGAMYYPGQLKHSTGYWCDLNPSFSWLYSYCCKYTRTLHQLDFYLDLYITLPDNRWVIAMVILKLLVLSYPY